MGTHVVNTCAKQVTKFIYRNYMSFIYHNYMCLWAEWGAVDQSVVVSASNFNVSQ